MPNITLTDSELLSVVNALLVAKSAYEQDRATFTQTDPRMSAQFAAQAVEAEGLADRLMEAL